MPSFTQNLFGRGGRVNAGSILQAILSGPSGNLLYNKYRSSRAKGKRRASREDAAIEKLLKKYGSEKFMQKDVLTGKQRSLLDFLSKHAARQQQPADITQNQLYQSGQNYLQDLMSQNPEAYQRFAAPAMRQFNEQIAPGIANRFAGTGSLSSSGFQNALAGAGADLGERLGSLRAGLQQQGVEQGLGYAQAPIENTMAQNTQRLQAGQLALGTSPYLNIYREPALGAMIGAQRRGSMSMGSSLLNKFLPAAATAAGSALGGPIGGAIGGGIGNLFT